MGKPLDKMESVPEAAMEGLPSAERLHEMGFAPSPSQVPPAQHQVVPLFKTILVFSWALLIHIQPLDNHCSPVGADACALIIVNIKVWVRSL